MECYGDEGNRNGKYRNTMHIAGIKRLIRVFGMDQIPQDAEYANVKPAKRPSGIYLLLTYYVPKKERNAAREYHPGSVRDYHLSR